MVRLGNKHLCLSHLAGSRLPFKESHGLGPLCHVKMTGGRGTCLAKYARKVSEEAGLGEVGSRSESWVLACCPPAEEPNRTDQEVVVTACTCQLATEI